LKVKSYHDDDAKVIGYEAGIGRCEGLVGALRVINKQGYTFGVGSGMTNALRQNPPAIGTMITYKYYGSTRDGLPRFPIFLRVKPEE
jgi:DNA ligase-1